MVRILSVGKIGTLKQIPSYTNPALKTKHGSPHRNHLSITAGNPTQPDNKVLNSSNASSNTKKTVDDVLRKHNFSNSKSMPVFPLKNPISNFKTQHKLKNPPIIEQAKERGIFDLTGISLITETIKDHFKWGDRTILKQRKMIQRDQTQNLIDEDETLRDNLEKSGFSSCDESVSHEIKENNLEILIKFGQKIKKILDFLDQFGSKFSFPS